MIIAGLDLETTGLDQDKGHRIIEIAMLLYVFNPETGAHNLRGRYVQRINPERAIDSGALAVHGITYEDVAYEPKWEEVAPKIVKLLSVVDVVVAHNGNGFDLPFLAAELLRIGQPVPEVRAFDTMTSFRWATPMGKVPNLGELCFACGVNYDTEKAHAAEYDVSVMLESFFIAHKKGFVQLPMIEKEV